MSTFKFKSNANCKNKQKSKLHKQYAKIKADQNQKVAYELALLESQSQDTFIDFLQKGYKKENINIAVKDFTNNIITAGKKVL